MNKEQTMIKRTAFVSLLMLVICISVVADEIPEIDQFKKYIEIKSVGFSSISPDGNFILFTERQPVWKENTYISQIWLTNLKTGDLRQMTFDETNKFSVSWKPDSKSFTFKKTDGGKVVHLYEMAVDGGGARQITKFEKSFGSYQFSKDGSKLLFSRSAEEDKTKEKIKKTYGSYHFHDVEHGRSELYYYDFETEEEKKLVGEEGLSVVSFELSPDEKQILYWAQPDNKITSFDYQNIFIYDIGSGESKMIVDDSYSLGGGIWSPDGGMIAYSSADDEKKTWFKNSHIFIKDLKTGESKNLTIDFDESPRLLVWREEGIYFWSFTGMEAGLFLLDPVSAETRRVTPDDGEFYSSFTFAKNADKVSFVHTSATDFRELWAASVKDFAPEKITDYARQVEGWTIATKEKVSWESTDGATIHGVLTKPADFDPEKKYPLLVVIHGGPTGIDYPEYIDGVNGYAYPIEEWAAKGAVILQPNYRGSAGFGEEFRSLNFRNLGVGDYWDVISGVDYLIEQGIADPDKLAAMGWSQGGYISAFITTYSDRFKAVSVGAGISDWVDYYYRTDITPFTIQYLGDDPWDDPEIYDKTSPMTYIKNAKTPTLIQHGENDARVPINNAYKLFRGLEDQQVPVYFAIYHGFGHGIRNPKENLALLMHNWNFFNKYLWGEDVEVMKMPGTEVSEEESEQETEETEEAS
jgi:dipeptidyl aminopeptidase/acylaminoacyl peptidase